MLLEAYNLFSDKFSLISLPFVLCLSILLYNKYGHGINKYNGPFLASVTSFWRFWDVWRHSEQAPYVRLHEKYGATGRLGPNRLIFSQPEAVRDIYGPKGLLQKSDMHLVIQQSAGGVAFPTLFASTDAEWHNNLRRKVNSAFTMSTVLKYEGSVDDTIGAFLEQLRTRFIGHSGSDGTCDFATWLRFFADDSVTQIVYGRRIGHLDNGIDKDGVLAAMKSQMRYWILVSQIPNLDVLIRRNRILMWLTGTVFLMERVQSPCPSQ